MTAMVNSTAPRLTARLSRNYSFLRSWRFWVATSIIALIAVAAFSWNWLIAIGLAPLLITLLPCGVTCALGLCMKKKAGPACHGTREAPGGASQA